jgi:ribonucleoside-triphosphate reductase
MVGSSVSYLTPKILETYKKKKPKHQGKLFEPIKEGRYSLKGESWLDTCKRVVDYSLSLYQGPATEEELKKESELMLDLLYNCIAFPAGRTLRIGGTAAADAHPEANFNCCFTSIEDLEDFCDVFHLSMCSCGVGYSVLNTYKLPTLNTDFEIIHNGRFETIKEQVAETGQIKEKEKFIYNSLYPYTKQDKTETNYLGWIGNKSRYNIIVGDSKLGWVEALRSYLRILNNNFNPVEISFDYSYVRPEGTSLNTWGGYAAGPDGLVRMFNFITKTIKLSNGKLRPIDVMDICDYIGAIVVVGGTRRAALICLFAPDDLELLNAKSGESIGWWEDQEGAHVEYDDTLFRQEQIKWIAADNAHRTMSNNSITFTKKPSYEQLQEIFKRIKQNGEPGFYNLEAARKRRPNVEGLNPCGEVLLANKGVCNLTTVNMMAFLYDKKTFFGSRKAVDYSLLDKAVRLITRIGLRQTNVTLSLPRWDEVQKRDRLLGVSKTGEMDLLDALGWKRNSKNHIKLLKFMNKTANEEADRYSYEMRVPRPLLVTSVKPEGTISQLPTVSSGLHRAFAPYYIRNIKFASFDPMCKALMELGVPWEHDRTKKDSNRIVFRFPIKTKAKIRAYDESLKDQFMGYINHQKYYTDHNTSCTLYVGERWIKFLGIKLYKIDEWEEALKLTYEHWDDMLAVTFLPKDNGVYPQAPYEAVSKSEFTRLESLFPSSLDSLPELIEKYAPKIAQETTMEESADCSTGACPLV